MTPEQMLLDLFPKDETDYLKVVSGYRKGFLSQFMGAIRALLKGDIKSAIRNKKEGNPFYDMLTGEWRDANGQRINAERALRLQINKDKDELRALTRKYMTGLDANGVATIPKNMIERWQRDMARKIMESNLRAYAIGHGTPKDANFKRIRGHLLEEFKFLDNFAQQIKNETLKKYDPITRSGMYADSALLAWSSGDIQGRDPAIWEGWRQLDPYAAHCPECPEYATDTYVNIDDLMPIGCCSTCRRHCKCSIKWRRKKEAYYQDLVGINADLLSKAKIAEINFQYYARMGLKTKEQARRYVILKRSLGHQAALEQALLGGSRTLK